MSADDGVYKYFSRPEVQQLIAGQGDDEFSPEVRAWFTRDLSADYGNIFRLVEWAKEQGYISQYNEMIISFMRAFE